MKLFILLSTAGFAANTYAQCKINIGTDQMACVNTKLTITATVTNAKTPYSYEWTIANKLGRSTQTTDKAQITVKQDDTVMLKLTDANNCVSRDTMLIIARQLPLVNWNRKPMLPRCFSYGDIELYPFVTASSLGDLSIWAGSLKVRNQMVDSISTTSFRYRTSSLDNMAMQNGNFRQDKIYVQLRDGNGCMGIDSTTQRINATPIVQLKMRSYCQNLGTAPLANSIIRPHPTIAATILWDVLEAPAGISKSGLLREDPVGSQRYHIDFGNPYEDQYAGTYKLRYNVEDRLTGCDASDTDVVQIIGEPVLTSATALFCEQSAQNNLLNIFKTNGKTPTAGASSFRIIALDGDTNASGFGKAKIERGHYLSALAKPGKWTIRCENKPDGCSTTADFDVVVNPSPVAGFNTAPADSTGIASPQFSVSNTSSIKPVSALTYEWYFDSRNPVLSDTARNPLIIYPGKDSTYHVKLMVKSKQGCSDTFIKMLKVGQGSRNNTAVLKLSGLKINSRLVLYDDRFQLSQLWVFDLSGRLVYNSHLNTGADINAGVYTYLLELKTKQGQTGYYAGKIMLE